MTLRTTKMRRSLTVTTICWAAACCAKETHASSNSPVVAMVDGTPIYHHQIEVHPGEDATFADARKIEKLDRQIREVIKTKAIQKIGIHVQGEEIRKEVNAKFVQAGIDDGEARRISDIYRALLAALEIWHQDETKSESIYADMLADYMTEAQWHQWQARYPAPEKLAQLRALVPRNLEDMKENSRNSAKRDLLHDRLIAHIVAGVRVSEHEIYTFYAEKYKEIAEKPHLSEVWTKLEARILATKKQQAIKQWWQARMREANIQINDERLKRSWEERNRRFLLGTL